MSMHGRQSALPAVKHMKDTKHSIPRARLAIAPAVCVVFLRASEFCARLIVDAVVFLADHPIDLMGNRNSLAVYLQVPDAVFLSALHQESPPFGRCRMEGQRDKLPAQSYTADGFCVSIRLQLHFRCWLRRIQFRHASCGRGSDQGPSLCVPPARFSGRDHSISDDLQKSFQVLKTSKSLMG